MARKQIGITTLVKQPDGGMVYTPAAGRLYTTKWKGEDAAVDAQAETEIGAGRAYVSVERLGNGKSILTLSDTASGSVSADASLSVVWSLQGQSENPSIWEHPKYYPTIAAMSDDNLSLFKQDLENFKAGNQQLPSGYDTWAAWTTGLGSILGPFARLYGRGVESYPASRYTLRKTKTMGPGTTHKVKHANVDRYYTLAQITSLDGDGPIPTAVLDSPNFPTGHWLKLAPVADQQSDGRVVYVQEWIFGPTNSWVGIADAAT